MQAGGAMKKQIERLEYESMYDFVFRWCYDLRERVCEATQTWDPDMRRYAMALTPEEYYDFCQETHGRIRCDSSGAMRMVGVAIVCER